MNYFSCLFDPAHWTGPEGIPARLVEHLGYVALTLVIALVIAVPIGAWIGHTGRGGFLVVGLGERRCARCPRSACSSCIVGPIGLGLIGPIVALVILAVPPILAGTYAGVRNVDPAVVDAARGMGMRGREVLLGVELPNALPLIIGGIRSAVLQVISTATIAAYVGARRARPLHHRRPGHARLPADDRRLAAGGAARRRRGPAARRPAEAGRLARSARRARTARAGCAVRPHSTSRPDAARAA